MRRVRCDQGKFGLSSVDDAENVEPARKATGFMTSDEYIAEAVERRCFGGHEHIQLLSGRPKVCEVSSTIGGGDLARFATEHACRGRKG